MPDPAVVTVMRRQRAALLAREAAQMQAMAGQWLSVERALEAQIAVLAQEAAELKRLGLPADGKKIMELKHYQELLPQVRVELEKYSDYTVRVVTEQQRAYAQMGLFDAQAAIDASQTTRIGVFFNRLPVAAVENMVGLAGDGSPLKTLLKATWPDTVQALTDSLVKGTALGWNPRRTAAAMRDAMAGQGLQRAVVIARTEQLRVHREASRQQYEASGIVGQFVRMSAHDQRVCAGCLMSEGEVYDTKDALREHVQGRCTMLPWLDGMPKPEWLRGADWFKQQDETMQRSILGKGHYEAWKAGKFDLDQLVTVRKNSVWGDSVQVTPLQDLVGGRSGGATAPRTPRPSRPSVSPAEQLSRGVGAAEQRHAADKTEYASAFDANGKLLFGKRGGKTDVTFTEAELDKLRGATLTHNHPGGGAGITDLSPDDIKLAVRRQLAEVRATGNDTIYSWKVPAGSTAKWTDMETRLEELKREVIPTLRARFESGELTEEAFLRRAHGQIYSRLAGEFGMEYKRTSWKP